MSQQTVRHMAGNVPSVETAHSVVLRLPEEGQHVRVAPTVIPQTGPVVVVGAVTCGGQKKGEEELIAVNSHFLSFCNSLSSAVQGDHSGL